MPGDKVCVQMRLDHVGDLKTAFARFFEIRLDVALRVDYGGDAVRSDKVGRVREAAEEELLKMHCALRAAVVNWVGGKRTSVLASARLSVGERCDADDHERGRGGTLRRARPFLEDRDAQNRAEQNAQLARRRNIADRCPGEGPQ